MTRVLIAACFVLSLRAAGEVDFARDIRPILSDRCFACHGPDESTRLVGLRLDTEDGAKKARGAKTPVVPGNPGASELLRRVTAEKPAMRMPPTASGKKPLTENEIGLVRRWIEQGAKWQSHWAFVAPQRPAVPETRNKTWARNAIDHFVLARLEREKLAPSPEADRARLLRRVTFDLTGLPPTPAEVDGFLADKSADAYEKVVDRLLASPRYGERMASDWLDAARYADTHGYQVDFEKEMWAWREWVIKAFNRNLPFDQFTVEQIAGDLLPNATLDQKIATGFHRNHRINTEAGSIMEEFHAENLVDRVSTTGSVWLGLTVGCARCHDHKYDPITARDFYRFYAFFNSVPEDGTGRPRDGRGNPAPTMKLPAPELEEQLAAKTKSLKEARAALAAVEAEVAGRQAAWEKTALEAQPAWETLRLVSATSDGGVKLEAQPDGSILSTGAHPAKAVYEIVGETKLTTITAFRLELIPDASLPGGGSGRGVNGKGVVTLFEVAILDGGKATIELDPRNISESRRKARAGLNLARISADFSSEESVINLVLRPKEQLKQGWDLSPEFTKPHYAVIEPAELLSSEKGMRFKIFVGSEYGEGALVGRFRLSVTGSEFPEPVPATIAKILKTGEETRTAKDKTALRKFFLSHPLERRRANDIVSRVDGQKKAIENKIPSTMVMGEMEAPRDTFLLIRGAYDKPGDKVTPGVPGFLPPLAKDAPANRLSLARWLVAAENPLTARVAVNRLWQSVFSTGLVKTSEDFGSQGDPPSHPELLDWLATEFVRSGWDVKAMEKTIVMSATYRQSSKSGEALRERDPENRLLARGPRFRLPAEMIRDQALAVAGLLTEKIGGPSVRPYQPDGLWEQLSVVDDRKLYIRSEGPDLWRRSLYTYWKRTVPPPALTTFDAPTREFCVVKRPLSSTPLQALALLNDETYVEASRKLAERMMTEGGTPVNRRLAYGFRLVTARPPSTVELSFLQAGLERRLAQYQKNRAAAEKLLSAGEAPRSAGLDAAELAAYTTAASVILNLDEVVTKQ